MKFTMNRIEYEIILTDEDTIRKVLGCNDNDDTYYYGCAIFNEQKVYLDISQPFEKQYRTLIHELLHIYIREYTDDLLENYTEEQMCNIVGNSFAILRKISKIFVDWYYRKDRSMWKIKNI